MRTLIYVPIIHTSADLGSLAEAVTIRGIAGLGENIWQEYQRTVEGLWDGIMDYFASVDVSGMKIYQDGMVAEGQIGNKIVEEGVKAGSRNYELVARLLKRGATLVKTEDFNLVKEERDRLVSLTQAKSIIEKLIAFTKYKLVKNTILNKRDNFIATRIEETLNHGERGVFFIGAFHDLKNRFSKSMQIIELKDPRKVREYQQLLPFYSKNRGRFEELSKYLIAKVEI